MRTPPARTLERKLAVLVQVLAGLDHAHQAGIVHRDIKPANIFICTDGTVKIMDFGVARLATASMTGTGKIVGTADYMSPEQVKGAKVDGRSDIFSVGCMLYELLAGRRPFHSDNLMAIFYKITHEEPAYELLPAGEADGPACRSSRRPWPRSSAERYQTARELAVDLREHLRSHSGASSAARALENLVEGERPADALVGATVVEADPLPSTYRSAPTAPAPSGVQPTLRGARRADRDAAGGRDRDQSRGPRLARRRRHAAARAAPDAAAIGREGDADRRRSCRCCAGRRTCSAGCCCGSRSARRVACTHTGSGCVRCPRRVGTCAARPSLRAQARTAVRRAVASVRRGRALVDRARPRCRRPHALERAGDGASGNGRLRQRHHRFQRLHHPRPSRRGWCSS